ncbi:MAG: hypothetical protein ABGY42_09205, partial [bacterium]
AHQTEALLAAPMSLFEGGAFHPASSSILFGEAAFGALPFFLPVFVVSGNPTLALNLTFLFAVAFTAAGIYLAVFTTTGRHAAGAIGVATLLGSRWLLWQWAPCAANYAIVGYLPWIFLMLVLGIGTRWRVLLLAGLVTLQGLASIYLAVASYLLLGSVALWRGLRHETRAEAARLASALVIAAVPLVLAFLPYLLLRMEHPEIASESTWQGTMQLTRLPWGPLDARSPAGVPLLALALTFAGGLVAVRSRLPAVERAAWRQALLWTGLGMLISLTPLARLGDGIIRMPHALLGEWFSAYTVIRAPHRLGVIALIGLAAGSGLGFAALLRLSGAKAMAAGVAALVLIALIAGESRTSFGVDRHARPLRLPARYPTLLVPAGAGPLVAALRTGEGPVLELPVPKNRRRRTAPEPQVAAMYRSIFHGRRVLNGYSGYQPPGFLERMELARRLPDAAALQELRAQTGLSALVVHTRALPAPKRGRWLALAERGGNASLELLVRGESGVLLFGVR